MIFRPCPRIAWYGLLLWLAAAGKAPPTPAQEKASEPPGLTRLAEGVYVDLADPNGNAVSNSGVVVLERSVLVFDTHFSPEAGQVLAARIRAVTPKPVRYVVLSHFHPDHTHGVQAFPSAHILSSTATRRDILQRDIPVMNRLVASTAAQIQTMKKDIAAQKRPELQETMRNQLRAREEFLARMSRIKVVPPALTTDDAMSIVDGSRRVRLEVLGTGHTEGDLVMVLPDDKIAFVGDLFFNQALPNTQDATILQWMKTAEALLKLEADRFIPGHGPVGTREDVKTFLAYLDDLKSTVEAAIAKGDGVEQLLNDAKPGSRFSSFQFQNFYPANLQQMYLELKAGQAAPAAPPAAAPAREERRKPAPEKPKP